LLFIKRHGVELFKRRAFQVCDTNVQLKVVQFVDQFVRAEELNVDLYGWIQIREKLVDSRQNRGTGWHRSDTDPAVEIAPHDRQFFQHTFAVRQQPLRPTDHPLSFRSKALVALMAENDRHIEFSLQLLQGARKTGLGYVAAFSRPTKVTLPLKCD